MFCPSLFWFKDYIHSNIALVLRNEFVRLTEWKENVYVFSREDWFWVQDTCRLQQYVNCELPDVQAGFRKGRGTRDQIASIFWITEKQESSRKTSIFALLTMPKSFDCVDGNKLWKILREMGTPDHLTCLLRNLYAGQEATVRTGHVATDRFQKGKRVRHEKHWTGRNTSWNQDCQEKHQ